MIPTFICRYVVDTIFSLVHFVNNSTIAVLFGCLLIKMLNIPKGMGSASIQHYTTIGTKHVHIQDHLSSSRVHGRFDQNRMKVFWYSDLEVNICCLECEGRIFLHSLHRLLSCSLSSCSINIVMRDTRKNTHPHPPIYQTYHYSFSRCSLYGDD